MKFTLPILVEAHPLAATRETEYRVRPVFMPWVEGRSKQLTRAISRLTADARRALREVAKERRHERLSELVFSPELDGTRQSVTIELRRRAVTVKLLFVTLETLGRTVAFATALPELWFEVPRVGSLVARAEEVLTEHFRKRELEDGEEFVSPERYSLAGNAWITSIDLDLHIPDVRKAPLKEFFATLGQGEVLDGADELESVGHCLDRAYPDDLDRVVLRDREVAELSRLLTAAEVRPVLLLGPRQVGKTAIVHEAVFRKVDEHKDPYRNQRNVWWLSPQRLISGMSYVGQWENRLIAILKEAAKREHVLFFDDVLGLYVAGQCSSSSLSVANVLKPYVDRSEVRLLAEMTPEAFRVLRERDRGFADLFDIIPVNETPPTDTLRVLMQTQRQLEECIDCSFEVDALPQVIDVTRRYARGEVFPGKAVRLLKRLAIAAAPKQSDTSASRAASAAGLSSSSIAVRGLTPSGSPGSGSGSGAIIDRRAVLSVFHEQSGLPLAFLDLNQKLIPADIATGLRRRFVGQEGAINAAVEIIGIAKARLNDPDRPLASLLLLGPTGVGKTQFAKAVAAYLFGSDERLIRFDMNEYVSAMSVPQLIGTFRNPEGLLTSAVRRSPFAVVLFDEIEKAHPDVFDLLLQVLGEGRLTDALGRTTDFTNTLILLTSNLGAQRSDTGLGFGSRDEHAKSVSVKAAENFFRPEFFNRLDRILPFDRLSRDDMQRVAAMMIENLFRRDGLTRRRVVPIVSPDAVEWIVAQGYEPVHGARALRRALDRELVRPIAAQLAAQLPSGLTVIQINRGEHGLSVRTQELTVAERIPNSVATLVGRADYDAATFLAEAGLAPPESRMGTLARPASSDPQTGKSAHPTESQILNSPSIRDVAGALPRAKRCLSRLRQNIDQLRPADAARSGQLSPEHERYFELRESWQNLHDEWQMLSREFDRHAAHDHESAKGAPASPRVQFHGTKGSDSVRSKSRHGNFAREFDADEEIEDFLNERQAGPELSESEIQTRLGELVGNLAWLDQISDPDLPLADLEQRGIVTLTFASAVQGAEFFHEYNDQVPNGSDTSMGVTMTWLDPRPDVSGPAQSIPPRELLGEIAFLVEGPLAGRLIASNVGTSVYRFDGELSLIRIGWLPISQSDSAEQVWRERQAQGLGPSDNTRLLFGPIVSADFGTCLINARSGLQNSRGIDGLVCSSSTALPLPREFVDAT